MLISCFSYFSWFYFASYSFVKLFVDRSGGSNEEMGEVLVAEVVQNVMRVSAKRSRNEIAMAVIEISQDELMRNRPREDQV